MGLGHSCEHQAHRSSTQDPFFSIGLVGPVANPQDRFVRGGNQTLLMPTIVSISVEIGVFAA